MDFLQLAEQFMPSLNNLGRGGKKAGGSVVKRRRVGGCGGSLTEVGGRRGRGRPKTTALLPSKMKSTREFIERALTYIDSSISDGDTKTPTPKASHSHGDLHSPPDIDVSFQAHRHLQLKNTQMQHSNNTPKRAMNNKFEKERLSTPLLHMKEKKSTKVQVSNIPLMMRPSMGVKVGAEGYASVEEMTSNLVTSINTLKTMNRNYTRIGSSIMTALRTIRTELKELKKKTEEISSESKMARKNKRSTSKKVANTRNKPKNMAPTQQKVKKPTKKATGKKKEVKKSQSEPQIGGEKGEKKEGEGKGEEKKKKEEEIEQLYPSKSGLKEKTSGGTQTNRRFLFKGAQVVGPKTPPMAMKPQARRGGSKGGTAFNEGLLAHKRLTLDNLKEAIQEKEAERKRAAVEATSAHLPCIMAPPPSSNTNTPSPLIDKQ